MRWQPNAAVCAECGFDWQAARPDVIDLVAHAPQAAVDAITRIPDPTRRSGPRWSAAMYLWHLVDAVRIGTERLLTLSHDPDRGIPCWDENAVAEARRYQQLSPTVGLMVLRTAVQAWTVIAAAAPSDIEVRHPQFGALRADDLIRRDGHEVHHHLMDINDAEAQ
ncbi:MAG TPA: hypothetical protein VME44_06460 [Streptosporangiaceae bacterium]|nr:hypothetical protein [Streptosporangiaceae bacterium]